tara:strand:- start:1555 stop:5217 length:3663 start_codon:yes stop_codon:yes gene_type:complete
MAAILQFRQGSKTSFISSGPYISEPFYDTDTNIIHIGKSGSDTITLVKLDEVNSGSLSLSGDLTASNATLSGDITIGGNIILGDDVTDDITISGQLDSNLIPKTDATYDLGSTTKKWNNLHVVSASIDSVDLTLSLPSGVISGSTQISNFGFDGYGNWTAYDNNGESAYVYSNSGAKFKQDPLRGDAIAVHLTTAYDSGTGTTIPVLNFSLDTGSVHFTDGIAAAGVPLGTISGSEQLPAGIVSGSEQLPSGLISGSEQLPSGLISGSSQVTESLDLRYLEIVGDGVISGSSQVIDILDELNTFSASQETKNTTLATYTSSVDTSVTSLNTFTSSYNTAISLNGDDVTIIGDLTVQGTQTQLNTQTLNIQDKNLLIASGAADSSAANGAGITIDGANKSLQWEHGTSQFVFDAQVSSSIGFKGEGGELTGIDTDQVTEAGNLYYTDVRVKSKLDAESIVSSSQQINANTITNFDANVNQKLNTEGVFSGSAQVNADTITNFDSNVKTKLDAETVVSSSQQVIDYLPTGTISGSTQLTPTFDVRYLEINGDNVLSSSNENFNDYSQSVDLRLVNTLSSGSDTSSSLHTLVGNFPTSGSLGTAAFYNVSSSLADDPNVIPNVKAVFDYINNTIGAADITGVSASLGLSGGGSGGYVSMSLDTGSTHFQGGVELYSSTLPSGVISGSSQITITESQISDLVHYTDANVKTKLDSEGVISGSAQTLDHLEASTLVAINQTSPSSIGADGELIINGSTNGYSGVLTLQSGSVNVLHQYATESDKMINLLGGAGYGLFLQPDNTTSKAWVIDTDGDFVSQGTGDVYAENVYSTLAISGSSLSLANNITLGGNIVVGGTIDGIDVGTDVAANTLKTGYTNALVKTKLDAETVVSGSDQVSASLDTRYVNLTGTETIEGNKTFDDNIIVEGNLTVNGTTTSVNSNTVNIGDNIIVLNSDVTGTPSQDAGIEIERGTSTNARIVWDESEDYWVAGLNNVTPGLSKIITAANVDYYTDTDNTTHLNTLGVFSSSLSAGDITEISNLTAVEGAQLENIGTTTISATQWGYLGTTDQALAQGDDVTFGTVRVDDTTASTTKGTGALIVDGGAGIGGSVNIGGTLKAEGDIIAYDSSDRRLKDKIIPIENPLEKINSIGGYSFLWNTSKQDIYKGKDYGVIAQEIETILPELVDTRENGYKAVKYDKLVSLLIEGIKELSTEVKELKEKINRE